MLLQYRYLSVLWKCRLNAVWFVQGRREMTVLPAVTAILLHHSAMDIWTDCSVVSRGVRGNGGSACRFFSSFTLQCYGYMD